MRRIAHWQHVGECLETLPRRHRRNVAGAWHVGRRFHHLHSMDVARAIRKNLRCTHAHDQLCAGKLLEQRIVELDKTGSVHAQTARLLEVDKQQRNRWVHEHVAETAEHAVAVVTRKRDLIDVGHSDEPRCTAFVRAVWPPVAIGGCNEEQRSTLDERTILVGELGSRQLVDQAIGKPARIEPILQPPHAGVIRIVRRNHLSQRPRAGRGCCPRCLRTMPLSPSPARRHGRSF